MRKGWQTKNLGEICDFEGGSQPPKSEFIYEEKPGYVRFLQIRDFGSDKNVTYIKNSNKNSLCNENDILIGRYGASVGKILTGKAGAYNVALIKTIPNRDLIDRSWFHKFLISNEFQGPLFNVADRSAQAGFSKNDIYNFPVPVPPLPEQQRIVAILDEAFEAIATAKANTEKNLQNARALFESALADTLARRGEGWVERRLSEISQQFGRGRSRNRPRNDPSLYDGVYPFIQTGDVRNSDHYIEAYEQTYNEAGLAQSKLWPVGTVCITIAANIAETGILTFDACFPNSVIGVVPDDRTDSGYLEYLLQGFKVQLQAQGKGSAQMNINMATFEDALFPFPSLEVQRQVATKLDTMREHSNTLKTLGEQKLRALEELQSALLHQAFTGNL